MFARFINKPPAVDFGQLVSVGYELVLQRPADDGGRAEYVRRLQSGEIDFQAFVQELQASAEYRQRHQAYDYREDPEVKPFLSADVLALSSRLEHERPIAWADYCQRFDAIFQQQESELIIGQRDYAQVHKLRFFELMNAMQLLGANRMGNRVLEFGASEFSRLYGQLFPLAGLDISDRPVPDDYIGFTRQVALEKLGAREYHSLDLTQSALFAPYAAGMPRYSHIVCCEVLEHLVVNPVELFSFFLNLLQKDGLIYLTTPNFFSFKNQRRMQNWDNPQEVYPAQDGNWDAHFHHREYALKEMLGFVQQAGGQTKAVYHSACWDVDAEKHNTCPAMAGNLVFVIGKT